VSLGHFENVLIWMIKDHCGFEETGCNKALVVLLAALERTACK
jgi:hypothetical protein